MSEEQALPDDVRKDTLEHAAKLFDSMARHSRELARKYGAEASNFYHDAQLWEQAASIIRALKETPIVDAERRELPTFVEKT